MAVLQRDTRICGVERPRHPAARELFRGHRLDDHLSVIVDGIDAAGRQVTDRQILIGDDEQGGPILDDRLHAVAFCIHDAGFPRVSSHRP